VALLAEVPDADLWAVRRRLKERLITCLRAREVQRRTRLGWSGAAIDQANHLLDPRALTLGFARRFATYKRAGLIFRDPERLAALLGHPERPVQIVFAGKAHPADEPGQAVLAEISRYCLSPPFAGRVAMLENYDMALARLLTQGVDVWLNTPRRPREASGTSGQKAAMNGVPNLSVLDGWWVEGYRGDNGWTIGPADDALEDEEAQDERDAASLYERLEQAVVPLFYERAADDVPAGWLAVCRAAMAAVVPAFTGARMVHDYVESMYLPAWRDGQDYAAHGAKQARELAAWRQSVSLAWPPAAAGSPPPDGQIRLGPHDALVRIHGLRPESVHAELIAAEEGDGSLRYQAVLPMVVVDHLGDGLYRFVAQGEVPPAARYGVRLTPRRDHLLQAYDVGRLHWF
jgi:starch phosphorylase